jgi:non-ribosomal peptide synthetase component F
LTWELSDALKKLSRKEGSTVFMTLLSAFNVLLYGYTWQEQIVVGTPIANRNHAEIEGLIGFFVNTLAIRTDLSGDPTFTELLRRVRKVMLGAYAHQDLPFEKLVEEIQPERDLNSSPLFQVMFVLQNAPMSSLELEGLTLSPIQADSGSAMFDLMMIMIDTDQGLSGCLMYDVDLFDPATISRLLEHFRIILEQVTVNPEIRLGDSLIHINPEGESSETNPVLQETLEGERFDF